MIFKRFFTSLWARAFPIKQRLKTRQSRRYRWDCSFSFSGCSVGAANSLSTLALAVKTSCISYPTPEALAARMVGMVDLAKVKTVLEPSAGKGDLLDVLEKRIKES